MSSPDSEELSKKKKRTRSAGTGEDAASKKTRGRPRVATQDATAADRRRTQIRLAQRAYRQRKETTIASLQEKNVHLQAIINQMNKHFTEFSDAAANSSVFQLDTTLTHHLKQVNGNFVTLLKSVCEGRIDGDEEMVDSQDTSEPASQRQHQGLPAQSSGDGKRHDIGWGYSTEVTEETRRNWEFPQDYHAHESERSFSTTPTAPSAPMYRTSEYDPKSYRPPVRVGQVMDQAITWNSMQAPERGESSELPFGMVNVSQPPPQHSSGTQKPQKVFPTPETTPPSKSLLSPPSLNSLFSNPKPVKAPWTYSHDETSFARRLARAAFETGYHLLSVAHQRPATVNRVFRLWVPHKSIDELREGFKELLGRGVHEDLDTWDSPFLHLGGAGTHYPRRDAQGNFVTRPNDWTIRSVGPVSSNIVQIENASDPSKNCEMKLDLTGFEGEWFDPFDVEGYLEQEKGVRIDPKESFAEVLIDDTDDVPDSPKEFSVFNSLQQRTFYPHVSRDTTPPPPPPPPSSLPRQSSTSLPKPHSNISPNASSTNAATGGNTNTLNNLFPPSSVTYALNLEMDMSSTMPPLDFNLFDEAIGLDLAPDFTMNSQDPAPPPPHNFPPLDFDSGVDMGPLGLDLMGAGGGSNNSNNQGHALGGKPQTTKKKAAWLDVSRMIDEMLQHAVCLGRSPGFRRKDVDRAFKKCLISAF
ncbi:hypothetical protein DM02DRAFT_732920 [Periconia macrospinosa]|uniref:BZIP domain-containing protein n=1 Tax=Periconia macrospinosa TaxID=97972 RepID=A0A2V1D9D1_9PLEO|nr:hypothetical protein DM02DRAFT_732920 [Periconia macrospinosa]